MNKCECSCHAPWVYGAKCLCFCPSGSDPKPITLLSDKEIRLKILYWLKSTMVGDSND